MTRRDYVAIAAAIMNARAAIAGKEPQDAQGDLQDGVSYAVDYLMVALGSENPRFDRARFLKACGVQS